MNEEQSHVEEQPVSGGVMTDSHDDGSLQRQAGHEEASEASSSAADSAPGESGATDQDTSEAVVSATALPVDVARLLEQQQTILDAQTSQSSRLNQLEGQMSQQLAGLTRLESLAGASAEQLSLLPKQGRTLAAKVDQVSASLSESRLRDVLQRVAQLLDLVKASSSRLEGEIADPLKEARRTTRMMKNQLRQLLVSSGLEEIGTTGAFDPEIHQALDTKTVDEDELVDQVLEVVRPGYRTKHSILRYAEVVVGCKPRPAEAEQRSKAEAGSASGESAPEEAPTASEAESGSQADSAGSGLRT